VIVPLFFALGAGVRATLRGDAAELAAGHRWHHPDHRGDVSDRSADRRAIALRPAKFKWGYYLPVPELITLGAALVIAGDRALLKHGLGSARRCADAPIATAFGVNQRVSLLLAGTRGLAAVAGYCQSSFTLAPSDHA
jgi:hypothetical protein